jgi:arabinofuranan 3-O-arabinosyltransferase
VTGSSASRSEDHAPPVPSTPRVTPPAERAVLALTAAVLAVVVLAQDWGVLTPDTKPEAFLAPWRTVGHTASAWQDSPFLGAPNFNVGLVPVTLATGLLSGSGVPAWLLMRLWRLLLLLVAGAGARAFYRDVTAGTPADRPVGRVVAAVAFVANPYLLLGGATTPTLLPMALLGWFLLALRRGFATPVGRGAWRGPAAAALIFAAMAGINAGVVPILQLLAVVPLVLDAHRREGRPWPDLGRSLLRTAPLLLVVSLYWLLPALAAVPVGTAIASTTETTAAIASTSSWAEVLRGLGMWTMYGADAAGPFQPNLLAYLGSPVVIAGSFALPVLAALGALLSRSPVRRLAVGLIATAAVTMVGLYPPDDPTPFGRLLRLVFEHVPGTIAFRTTNKAGGVLVLGVALLVALGAVAVAALVPAPPARALAAAAAAGLAVAATGPAWTGDLYGTHVPVPGYWLDAARAIDAGDRAGEPGAPSRVLFTPGVALPRYRWGYAGPDELGNSLLDRPTTFRSAVPAGTPAAADLLAGVDARLNEGSLPPGTLSALARYVGAGDVLLRDDDVWELADGGPPAQVWAAATADPGLRAERSFGAPGQFTVGPRGPGAGDDRVPPLGWFSVAGGHGPVRQVPQQGAVVVDGDGEAFPDLVAAGDLAGDPALLYAGAVDGAALPGALASASRVVLTDTNRRAPWNTHLVADATGPLLGPAQDPSPSRALFGAADQTVGTADGTATVTQTGGGLVFGPAPYGDPALALDGDPTTAWSTGNFDGGIGDALVVRTRAALDVPVVSLRLPPDATRWISKVRVTVSGAGRSWSADRDLSADAVGAAVPVDLPAGVRGTTVEVRILAVTGPGFGPVGIAELSVPGVTSTKVAALPTGLPARIAALGETGTRSLTTTPVDVLLRRRLGRPGTAGDDEESRLQRDITLPVTRSYRVHGHVRASASVPDAVLQQLLGQRASVTATASSREFGNPLLRATAAVDDVRPGRADLGTGWQPADPAVGQWIEVHLPRGPVDAVTVTQPVPGQGRATAVRATITLDGSRSYDVRLGPGRVSVALPAQPASTVRITLRGRSGAGQVRISDVTVSRTRGTRPLSQPDPRPAPCVTVSTVDGAPLRVQPLGTAAQVAAGAPVPVVGCDGSALPLAAGRHGVRGVADWVVDDLQLTDTLRPERTVTGAGSVAAPEVLSTSDTGTTVRTAATTVPTYLVAGRGYDAGWTARADGRDLGAPVLVDAYSVGWRLPAGPGRLVEIAYGPRTTAALAGAGSIAAAVLCALLAASPGWRRRWWGRLRPRRRAPQAGPPAALAPRGSPPVREPAPVAAHAYQPEESDGRR